MNLVWRFYRDNGGAWRWQQLETDHSVISDSPRGYATYDECLAEARKLGYAYAPSQERGRPPKRYADRGY